jgi:NAD(P)-dependent dehydrogenase (short-subunit alcohol dehydrogenase family)
VNPPAGRTPAGRTLAGRRILVVGASSGIGRSTALAASRAGAGVAITARRRGDLDAAALDGGPHVRAFPADVTDADAVSAMVDDAVAWLGGLDTVVYAAGKATLSPLETTPAEVWQSTFATNVTGAAVVSALCLPHLRDGTYPGTVVLVSSHSVGEPWPGLVAYAASKAALDELGRGLAGEHPTLRVLRVVVGNTATGFADGWDAEAAGTALSRWFEAGYLRHRVLEPDEVADRIVAALADREPPGGRLEEVRIVGEEQPPAP